MNPAADFVPRGLSMALGFDGLEDKFFLIPSIVPFMAALFGSFVYKLTFRIWGRIGPLRIGGFKREDDVLEFEPRTVNLPKATVFPVHRLNKIAEPPEQLQHAKKQKQVSKNTSDQGIDVVPRDIEVGPVLTENKHQQTSSQTSASADKTLSVEKRPLENSATTSIIQEETSSNDFKSTNDNLYRHSSKANEENLLIQKLMDRLSMEQHLRALLGGGNDVCCPEPCCCSSHSCPSTSTGSSSTEDPTLLLIKRRQVQRF